MTNQKNEPQQKSQGLPVATYEKILESLEFIYKTMESSQIVIDYGNDKEDK